MGLVDTVGLVRFVFADQSAGTSLMINIWNKYDLLVVGQFG